MEEASYYAAIILNEIKDLIGPGISTYEIDQEARLKMEFFKVKSACYQYKFNDRNFPSYICISVNNEVVHGIGSPGKFLKTGDIVSLDVSIIYKGFASDNAITVGVGKIDNSLKNLINCTKVSLYKGIQNAVVGNNVGNISFAIQRSVESKNYSIVRDFVGHGIGRFLHENPPIPNFGSKNLGPVLQSGMILAIEPMVNQGKSQVYFADDGWTALTLDGSNSAHYEHTVLVTNNGPKILTNI